MSGDITEAYDHVVNNIHSEWSWANSYVIEIDVRLEKHTRIESDIHYELNHRFAKSYGILPITYDIS